jgi:5-hydroxyisourate hydrolase-like protein (transthyretin family)
MGKTSVFVDPKVALEKTKDWKVTEASDLNYFNDDRWVPWVVTAEEFDSGEYIFKLKNGDFVKVEI